MRQPIPDPPIDEIHKIREQISAEFDHDPKKLIEYYRRLEEEYKDRILDTSKDKDRDHHAA